MKRLPETILGLSLGTRHIGLAVLEKNRIRERRMKVYTEGWSEIKLLIIISMLKKIIMKHGVTIIAIKAINPSKSSPSLNQILQAVGKYANSSKIAVFAYPIEELERYYSMEKRVNKGILMEAVLAEYPELIFEYRNEQKRKNPYFVKVFESIAAARLCSQELE